MPVFLLLTRKEKNLKIKMVKMGMDIDEKSKCIKNKEFFYSLIEDKNKLFEEEKEIEIEDSIDMEY